MTEDALGFTGGIMEFAEGVNVDNYIVTVTIQMGNSSRGHIFPPQGPSPGLDFILDPTIHSRSPTHIRCGG